MTYKNSFTAFMLSFFLLFPAFAQSQDLKFGLKGGVNASWASEDPGESKGVRGWNTAFFTEWQLSGRFSALLDLGLNQRGFARVQQETDETGGIIGDAKATSKTSYLSVTPHVNFHFSKSHWQPYIGAGPRLDFLIDKAPGEYEFTTAATRDDTADLLDEFVVGTSVFAGIKHGDRDGFQWRLEVRYERDLSDSLEPFPGTFRNNTLALVAGISF
jgi:hypothetical protein